MNQTILKLEQLYQNGELTSEKINALTDNDELLSLIATYRSKELNYEFVESLIEECYRVAFTNNYGVIREGTLLKTMYLQGVTQVPRVLLEAFLMINPFGYVDYSLEDVLENDEYFKFFSARYYQHVANQNNVAKALSKFQDISELLEQKDFLTKFQEQMSEMFNSKVQG